MKRLLPALLSLALAFSAFGQSSTTTNTSAAQPGVAAANINGTVAVANGGTGLATATAYSVVLTGTSATAAWKANLGPGTSGQSLIAGGAGAYPAWGTLGFAFGGTGLTSAADDTVMVSSGSAWVAKAIPDCTDVTGNHLNYTASTNAFSCGTTASAGTAAGSGSVTLTSANVTTTSTTLVDLTGATVTFTTGANPVLCGFTADITHSIVTQFVYFNLMVDAALQLGTAGLYWYTDAGGNAVASFTFMTAALSAASHTIKIQWKVGSGTGTVVASSATAAHFWCREQK